MKEKVLDQMRRQKEEKNLAQTPGPEPYSSISLTNGSSLFDFPTA